MARPGLHILSQITEVNAEHALAVQYASEIIEVEPFQESGYRHLMQLHADWATAVKRCASSANVASCS